MDCVCVTDKLEECRVKPQLIEIDRVSPSTSPEKKHDAKSEETVPVTQSNIENKENSNCSENAQGEKEWDPEIEAAMQFLVAEEDARIEKERQQRIHLQKIESSKLPSLFGLFLDSPTHETISDLNVHYIKNAHTNSINWNDMSIYVEMYRMKKWNSRRSPISSCVF